MTALPRRATVKDLMSVEGRAELVRGEVRRLPAFGCYPAGIIGNIAYSLGDCEGRIPGEAYTSTLVYVIPPLPSGRETISPAVSWYHGPHPEDRMGPIIGPPTFAAEVRCLEDYRPGAEAELAAKREDYFQAGTLVVWDVCPMTETVRSYRRGQASPTLITRGMIADAEPAVPGWRISWDDLFDED